MADTGRTRASVSGDAVDFTSLTPFGDATGTGIAAEYMATRTGQPGTTGWVTHSIIPSVPPASFSAIADAQDTLYQGEFSDDLSKGVLHSYNPVTSDPAVAGVSNIYLRQDLLAPGNGSYTLLSGCPACSSPLTDPLGFYLPTVADATPDFGHVVFEAPRQLTPDAPPQPANCIANDRGCRPSLYEWDHGTLRFVGILPDGSAAPISIAGLGARAFYALNTISDDGSKVFFTSVSTPSSTSGDLYMRVNHTSTVQLNASERTDCADHDPCTGAPEPDPGGSQPATYLIASPDGSKVFFTSSEQLTDSPGGDLYVYDTTLPVSDPNHLQHVFVDQQPADGNTPTDGVFGISSDGSYLYFLDPSAILPGQPLLPGAAEVGLYLWHNGEISFVGSIDDRAAGADTLPADVRTKLAARVAPDGRTLLFTAFSGAGLRGDNHGTCDTSSGTCAELYVYKAGSGTPRCISCNPTGAPATSSATFRVRTSTGATQTASHLNHPMTTDGNHVFFETGERLLPQQDTNGNKSDVYEWTAAGVDGCTSASSGYSAIADGCLALITTGTSTDDSHFLDASPSGHDVFFTTNQQLVGWDTDTAYDLYDARIGGGFPNPPAARPECSGQACHGTIAPPPTIGLPATSTFFHNSVAPKAPKKKVVKKCARGKVHKRVHGKVKCVKKPKAKRAVHKHRR